MASVYEVGSVSPVIAVELDADRAVTDGNIQSQAKALRAQLGDMVNAVVVVHGGQFWVV